MLLATARAAQRGEANDTWGIMHRTGFHNLLARRPVTSVVTRIALVSLALLATATACGTPSASEPESGRASATVASTACGATGVAPPRTYDHVIWIFEENHNLEYDPGDPGAGVIANPDAPYISQLATTCSYSSEFTDTHPGMHSEPHYLAAVSGSNCDTGFGATGKNCITDDKSPSHHVLATDNLFSQLERDGKTWTSYQESAPANCHRAYYSENGAETFGPKHDPALFFTNLNESCPVNDVVIPTWAGGHPGGRLADDITEDQLPAFSFISPNEQNDMHISTGGSVERGDAWLAAYLPLILESASYKEGRTAVFVLWDENYKGGSAFLPNLMIAPTARPGALHTRMNNISVLRATQDMLGLTAHNPLLGCASGKPPGGVGQCPPESVADVRAAANL